MVYPDDPESGSTHCAGSVLPRFVEPDIELDDGGDLMAEAKSSTDLDNGDVIRVALGGPPSDKVVNNESDSGVYRNMRHLGYCTRCHPSALPSALSPFVITYFADLELAQVRTGAVRGQNPSSLPVRSPSPRFPSPPSAHAASALCSLRDPIDHLKHCLFLHFPPLGRRGAPSKDDGIHMGPVAPRTRMPASSRKQPQLDQARIRQDLRHPGHGGAIEESECVSRVTECGVSHEQRATLDFYKFRNEVYACGCSGGREGGQETEGGLVRGRVGGGGDGGYAVGGRDEDEGAEVDTTDVVVIVEW
ncbi:hypothetical protein EDB83DRAFT_2319669 [Lactarius deliciosus]|nr:hypothetical protein EDB83DRAFT_2319669 [Lactarius deliciosus]